MFSSILFPHKKAGLNLIGLLLRALALGDLMRPLISLRFVCSRKSLRYVQIETDRLSQKYQYSQQV